MNSVIYNPLEEFENKYKNLHAENTNKFCIYAIKLCVILNSLHKKVYTDVTERTIVQGRRYVF